MGEKTLPAPQNPTARVGFLNWGVEGAASWLVKLRLALLGTGAWGESCLEEEWGWGHPSLPHAVTVDVSPGGTGMLSSRLTRSGTNCCFVLGGSSERGRSPHSLANRGREEERGWQSRAAGTGQREKS